MMIMSVAMVILCIMLGGFMIRSCTGKTNTSSEAKQAISEVREGANKQVISSQADSLIKISRIWADFFPANTSNQPI